MKKRVLEKANLSVSEFGFGGAIVGNLYQPLRDEEAYQAIRTAYELGVCYFDTAPLYGNGLSEARIGDALSGYPRDSYILSTKVGRDISHTAMAKEDEFFSAYQSAFDFSYDGIMRSFEASLKRLRTDYVDIVYVHDIGRLAQGDAHEAQMKIFLEEGYRALESLRANQQVRAIGLGVNEYAVGLEILQHIELDCMMLAGQHTLLQHEAAKNFFPECKRKKIAVIAAGPFNSGMLINGERYNYAPPDEKVIERVDALRDYCRHFSVELPVAAIQFPLLHPQVASVVTGVRTKEEVMQSIQFLQKNIPAVFWQELKTSQLITSDAVIG